MSRFASRPVVALTLSALCTLAIACAGGGDQSQFTLTRRPIINGTVDNTHTSVVALTHPYTGQFCTGTVIAPRVILSAGHCLVEMQKEFQQQGVTFKPTDVKIFYGTTVGSSGQSVGVSAAYAHPQYALLSNGAPQYDVSVWLLTQNSPEPAMAWQKTPLGNVTGQTVTLVGYGVTDAQSQTGNGTRRTVQAQISGVDDQDIYYGNGYSGTCQGDSGGPMFLNQGGAEVLIGVTSYGDQSCVQEGANARVDAFADFINQYVGQSTQVQPVSVTITAPANGAVVGSAFDVTANVTSPAGVSQVDLLIDGAQRDSLSVAPWTFSVIGMANGTHQITVKGTGSDGGSGQATISVTVGGSTPPPTGGCSDANPCGHGYACVNGQCLPQLATSCSDTSPCQAGYDCVSGQCVQAPPPAAGTTGASCTSNSECQSGICVDGNTPNGFCTQVCGSNTDCPHTAACQSIGGMNLCGAPYSAAATPVTTKELNSAGCSVGGHGAAPAWSALLLVVALGLCLRRRSAR
jgi:V8-like Glu-specific endopeptidase